MAEEAGLDLVEIAPMAVPPVCKLDRFRQVQVPGTEEGQHEADSSKSRCR
jgi:translation initiation factor IF-3